MSPALRRHLRKTGTLWPLARFPWAVQRVLRWVGGGATRWYKHPLGVWAEKDLALARTVVGATPKGAGRYLRPERPLLRHQTAAAKRPHAPVGLLAKKKWLCFIHTTNGFYVLGGLLFQFVIPN